MGQPYKILVAGVGGQGVVFFTNLLVRSALLDNIPVVGGEIYGSAYRGG
ncbi:MAG: indolepyruvate oxidoreductase, partial [Bacteroidetes bacterium]